MIVICAWHKPHPVIIGEVEPLDDPTPTHGMCPECAEEFKAAHLAKKALNPSHQWWCGGKSPCACTDSWKALYPNLKGATDG